VDFFPALVMKIRRVPYAEVIGYWIEFEYRDRKDFRKHIETHFSKKDIRLITGHHDYRDDLANARRWVMLWSYRRFISWFDHAKWWEAILNEKDVQKLSVIHAPHWEFLSSGTVKALDIAITVEEGKWSGAESYPKDDGAIVRMESKKMKTNLKSKIKSKKHSTIVVVNADGGKELTVIDGVHRTVRTCLYYFVRNKADPKEISQRTYLGITPDPIHHSSKQWSVVDSFFESA